MGTGLRDPRGWISLAAFGLVSFSAAAVGAAFPPGEWYGAIAKPPWTPPGWLFGPVWTLLYVFIAVAGWRVWMRVSEPSRRVLLWLWSLQMALNAAWSWLFFGLREPGIALANIVCMLALIVAFIALAWRPHRLAAGLFIPYAAWVGFASALNASIWWLNR